MLHAILIHRRVDLLKVIQFMFVFLAFGMSSPLAYRMCVDSRQQALLSSGRYVQNSELHEGNMPVDCKPSNWDLIVTRHCSTLGRNVVYR
jgi:hypothetical protein